MVHFSDWLKPAGRSNGTFFDKAETSLLAPTRRMKSGRSQPDKKVHGLDQRS
jgi:hypothetical protein